MILVFAVSACATTTDSKSRNAPVISGSETINIFLHLTFVPLDGNTATMTRVVIV